MYKVDVMVASRGLVVVCLVVVVRLLSAVCAFLIADVRPLSLGCNCLVVV